MKNLSLIALITLIVAQFFLPAKMIQGREHILQNGEVFRFITRPIDPADPFQGRYVQLGYENDFIPSDKQSQTNMNRGVRVYATIGTDEDGFAHFTQVSQEKPEEGHFLQTRCLGIKSTWDRKTKRSIHKGIRVEIPFDRFYMEEAKAPRAEQLVRSSTRSTNCWVSVRILNGKAVIEDVYAEGQSIRVLAAEKE